ncbi:phosphotransferase [Bartonella sp. HY329]|uniref:phosphotransferase enzyme family protein n=1 Tax=unclassified Bartonella TaxID=2645622 RepID=UPI0021C7AE1D|nr:MULTISPECIES: phosphotransferase [unclassified Bartonella]UXM95706.1 phosphotransferase [Bartonella sp. HY329]UXN10031.1 phosphotransferase [Bartonella sp. HY328]
MFYTRERLAFLAALVKDNIRHWGFHSNAEVALLTYSENATFIIQDKGQKRVLRVYRPHYHSNAEILSELQFMQKVEQQGNIILPHIYKTKDNQYFLTLHAENTDWRIACFSFIEGIEPKISDDLPQWFNKLGGLAAQLHSITRDWPSQDANSQNIFTRKSWAYETMIGKNAYWGNWRAARLEEKNKALLEICDAQLKNVCETLANKGTKFSLLHADLRLANLLKHKDELAIIDFDDCGFSWLGLDFANAISFIENEPIVPLLQDQWLSGYAKVREPDRHMIESLPHLIMMRRMQLTAWLMSHNETPTAIALNDQFGCITSHLAKIYLHKHG